MEISFTHYLTYGHRVLGPKNSRPGHKNISSGTAKLFPVVQTHATIHLDKCMRPFLVYKAAQSTNLVKGMWNEFLTTKTGIYTHKQDEIHIADNIFEQMYGRSWIEGDTGLHAGIMYLAYNTMQMWTSLVMYIHKVGSQSLHIGNELLRLDYHKMHVERFGCKA